MEEPLPGCKLLIVSSYGGKRKSTLSDSFLRTSVSFMRALPLLLNHHPKVTQLSFIGFESYPYLLRGNQAAAVEDNRQKGWGVSHIGKLLAAASSQNKLLSPWTSPFWVEGRKCTIHFLPILGGNKLDGNYIRVNFIGKAQDEKYILSHGLLKLFDQRTRKNEILLDYGLSFEKVKHLPPMTL